MKLYYYLFTFRIFIKLSTVDIFVELCCQNTLAGRVTLFRTMKVDL